MMKKDPTAMIESQLLENLDEFVGLARGRLGAPELAGRCGSRAC